LSDLTKPFGFVGGLKELQVAKAPGFPLQALPKKKFDALFQGIFRLHGLKCPMFHTATIRNFPVEHIRHP
jgi:hypothetical protein